MRTTISIGDNILKAAKRRARQLGITLGELVESALRRELERTPRAQDRPEVPVFRGGMGLRAGIDATSTRELLEVLDRDRSVEELK